MTTPNLTPKQMKILSMIRESRLSRGYSPTMQELGDALGVSKVTVFEHVGALIKKGCLTRDPNKARSLELSPDLELPDEQRNTKLPLVGSIAAGSPIEAVETREHLDLEEVFSPPGSRNTSKFVLKVRGDSMIDVHIADGDYVVCEQRNAAKSGDIVVALVDNDEATLKYYRPQRDGTVHLEPANSAYEPIVVKKNQLQIQGVCIGVVRAY
ncbi:transcriptional repressor LexA [Phycisphaeraceae bacterium D3-23]